MYREKKISFSIVCKMNIELNREGPLPFDHVINEINIYSIGHSLPVLKLFRFHWTCSQHQAIILKVTIRNSTHWSWTLCDASTHTSRKKKKRELVLRRAKRKKKQQIQRFLICKARSSVIIIGTPSSKTTRGGSSIRLSWHHRAKTELKSLNSMESWCCFFLFNSELLNWLVSIISSGSHYTMWL